LSNPLPGTYPFQPKLGNNREDGYASLELLMVNRSGCAVWILKATVLSMEVGSISPTAIYAG